QLPGRSSWICVCPLLNGIIVGRLYNNGGDEWGFDEADGDEKEHDHLPWTWMRDISSFMETLSNDKD
ncbi:hypothetical protein LCGC14_2335680, partial [marine sediment metagenome]